MTSLLKHYGRYSINWHMLLQTFPLITWITRSNKSGTVRLVEYAELKLCHLSRSTLWCLINHPAHPLSHTHAHLWPLNNVRKSPSGSSLDPPFINLGKFNPSNCKIFKTIPSIKGVLTNFYASELYCLRKRISIGIDIKSIIWYFIFRYGFPNLPPPPPSAYLEPLLLNFRKISKKNHY